jgi:lysozyme
LDTQRFPSARAAGPWTFWQYSDRGRLAGYQGPENYIDLNVFCAEWQTLMAIAG